MYDLGIHSAQWNYLKSLNFIEMKGFPFDAYPNIVDNLYEYRWKPLIVAQELELNPVVQWMDSSTLWLRHGEQEMLQKVSVSTRFLQNHELI